MEDREVAQELLPALADADEPVWTAVGVGGAGINALRPLDDAAFHRVAMDTDEVFLALSGVPDQVTLGRDLLQGTGTRGQPALGRRAARAARDEIAHHLEGDLLLLLAGLGRGTGTGAAPVVAEIAGGRGMAVLALLVWPFREERVDDVAASGLEALRGTTDAHLVLDNEAARRAIPGAHWEAAQEVNAVLVSTVESLLEAVQGTPPFALRGEVAAFLEGLRHREEELPFRTAGWSLDEPEVGPLAMNPGGFIKRR